MGFTYLGTGVTDLDNIRMLIQDTSENSGIKPEGKNFSDEEIAARLSVEGTVNRTVANLYEILSVSWSTWVTTRVDDGRSESRSDVSKVFAKRAKEWRDIYGYGESTSTMVNSFVTRKDGYSDDIDSGEVT